MKKVEFLGDQNKTSLQEKEKENLMPWYNNRYKEAKKVNERKARKQFIYALRLFDTLVTPICCMKLWGFKALKSWEKKTATCKFLQIYLKRETIDSRQFCL